MHPFFSPLLAGLAGLLSVGSTSALRIPSATTITLPSQTTTDRPRSLAKRAGWVEVCPTPGVAANCKVIGIDEVTAAPAGGHYVPECDVTGHCNWIGYAEPTGYAITDTTGYQITTANGENFIIPVGLPVPPVDGPPIVPPPVPTNLPDPPQDPSLTRDFTNPPVASTTATSRKSVSNTWTSNACVMKPSPVPTCMPDGAPWMNPTRLVRKVKGLNHGENNLLTAPYSSFCDCGPSQTYPTLPLVAGQTTANCAYQTLTPASQIHPTTTSAAPTNIPGQGGVQGCVYYIAADQGLPPGTSDYCHCGGGPNAPPASAPLLTHSDVSPAVTDCNYPTQPPTTWSIPVPHSTTASPTTASPTPAASTCNGPGLYDMRQPSAVASAAAYCSLMAFEATQGMTLSSNWPGSCSYQNVGAVYQPPAAGEVEAGMSDILFWTSQDTSSDYCKVQQPKFNEADCNLGMNIAINGCTFHVASSLLSFATCD